MEDSKFLSRKFILTIIVIILVGVLPIVYKTNGVGDSICMTVLGLLGAVGVAYGFINLKEAKAQVEEIVTAQTSK